MILAYVCFATTHLILLQRLFSDMASAKAGSMEDFWPSQMVFAGPGVGYASQPRVNGFFFESISMTMLRTKDLLLFSWDTGAVDGSCAMSSQPNPSIYHSSIHATEMKWSF